MIYVFSILTEEKSDIKIIEASNVIDAIDELSRTTLCPYEIHSIYSGEK